MSNQIALTLKEDLLIENKILSKKRTRRNDVDWSLEEEYLFFEAHSFLGNKWKKYSSLISK